MSSPDLVTQLRAAGDPPHLVAAEALVNLGTRAERLQERVSQLEAIARLNVETVRNMQRAQPSSSDSSGLVQRGDLALAPPVPVTRITDAASALFECALIGVCVKGKVFEWGTLKRGDRNCCDHTDRSIHVGTRKRFLVVRVGFPSDRDYTTVASGRGYSERLGEEQVTLMSRLGAALD